MCDACAVATDPLGDVLSFIDEFEQLYGTNHPEFYRGTYSQVNSPPCFLLDDAHCAYCLPFEAVLFISAILVK